MILLTGATGFIGRCLLGELLKKYGSEEVIAYSRLPIPGVKCILHNGYEQDSFNFVANGLSKIKTIIHVGAFTPKNKLDSDNEKLANLNVIVTNCLLNSNLPNLKRFIYLSTLDVYAPAELINETTPLLRSNAYSRSKVLCEELVVEWSKKTGGIGQLLRIGHVYGPGEEAYQKIIPETMRRLKEGLPLQLLGTGKQQRAFIYVKDVCSAILAALDLEQDVGPINIAGSYRISMEELINLIVDISRLQAKIEVIKGVESRDIVFDNSKLIKYLLSNETSLRDGLKKEWNYMVARDNEYSY
jgi:nucleoside-diphosphate-sugar epimerase